MLEEGIVALDAYADSVVGACEVDAASADCGFEVGFACLADAESDVCADLTTLNTEALEAAAEAEAAD